MACDGMVEQVGLTNSREDAMVTRLEVHKAGRYLGYAVLDTNLMLWFWHHINGQSGSARTEKAASKALHRADVRREV